MVAEETTYGGEEEAGAEGRGVGEVHDEQHVKKKEEVAGGVSFGAPGIEEQEEVAGFMLKTPGETEQQLERFEVEERETSVDTGEILEQGEVQEVSQEAEETSPEMPEVEQEMEETSREMPEVEPEVEESPGPAQPTGGLGVPAVQVSAGDR